MRKFQDEISSDEDEDQERKNSSKKLGLIEKLRIKREKEKLKRAEKMRLHSDEIEKYKSKIDDLLETNRNVETNLKEKETKYDLLAEEFNSVQKNFSAYKASREEVDICSFHPSLKFMPPTNKFTGGFLDGGSFCATFGLKCFQKTALGFAEQDE